MHFISHLLGFNLIDGTQARWTHACAVFEYKGREAVIVAGGRITSTPGDELTSVEVIMVVVIVIMMVTDGAGDGNGAGGIGDGKTSWPGDGVGTTLLDVQGSPASTTAGSCYGRPGRETPPHWGQLRGECWPSSPNLPFSFLLWRISYADAAPQVQGGYIYHDVHQNMILMMMMMTIAIRNICTFSCM